MAQKYGDPRGKTECWYALAAKPGATVAVGVKPGTTLAQIEEEIQAGTLEASLNAVPVSAGDMIFVDAGTIHAIWPGSILPIETQQDCDLTYRMFDYGRGRELYIAKSIEATKLTTRAGKIAPRVLADRTVLIDAEYFRVERIPVEGSRTSGSSGGKLRGLQIVSQLSARADSADKASSPSICRREGLSRRLQRRRSSCLKIWALRKANST